MGSILRVQTTRSNSSPYRRHRLRRPWADGTTSVVLSPLEFIKKRVALTPAPRAHQVTYHGVLAAAAPGSCLAAAWGQDPSIRSASATRIRLSAMRWADILLRVSAVDALACPRCAGRMRLISSITRVRGIRAILESVGLSSAPPRSSAASDLREGLKRVFSGLATHHVRQSFAAERVMCLGTPAAAQSGSLSDPARSQIQYF